MDIFRDEDELIAWIKTPTTNEFRKLEHEQYLYAEPHELLTRALIQRGIPLRYERKKQYDQSLKRVLKIPAPIQNFERFITSLEKDTLHQVPLYNADIPPEQHYFYKNNLYPGAGIDENFKGYETDPPVLRVAHLHKHQDVLFYNDEPIELSQLQERLNNHDPDVITAVRAFQLIPQLAQEGINFHRYKNKEIKYRGGKAYWSYGQVKYKDFGVRLHGRFLVDTKTMVGSNDPDAILELCKLSSTRYQQLASRSSGSVFQGALMRELVQDDILICHKQKPTPKPVALNELVNQDRAGISLDARVGIHSDVAEIDFTSMFPWLMHTKNISAETISNQGVQAPGVDVHIRQDLDGYVARSLKAFLDARLAYKANPTPINRKKAAALKGVLVSANGYLRYREFKLGLPTTHVALCAYVRKYFLEAKTLAQERGYDVLHGLVDSLYIHKKDLHERDVQRLIWDIEKLTGIPMEFEGRFKWIVFLPSVNEDRPVPTRYYGALENGEVKIRGVEARQASQPPLIRTTQEAIIRYLAQFDKHEMQQRIPQAIQHAKNALQRIEELDAQNLAYTVRISKEHYKHNCPQKRALKRYTNINVGERIHYVHDARGIRRIDEYQQPDTQHYTEAMIRALYSIFGVFGYTKKHLRKLLAGQTTLTDYIYMSKHIKISHGQVRGARQS